MEANKRSARRLYEEVFGLGNVDVADEILAEDAVNHGPGTPPDVGTAFIKRQAVLLRAAFPDLKVTLHEQLAEGDLVASRWNGTGTFTGAFATPAGPLEPTGRAISFDEIRIDRFSDGLVVESWFLPDRLTLWTQIGLLPPPAPR